jgi:hypothetical protein
MPNWDKVGDATDITTSFHSDKVKTRKLAIYRQNAVEYDDSGAVAVSPVLAANVTAAVKASVTTAVKDATDRARKCLNVLTGGNATLDDIDTVVGKIAGGAVITKDAMQKILYSYSYREGLNEGQKKKALLRFFGSKAALILTGGELDGKQVGGIDSTWDSAKGAQTTVSPAFIFRTVLGLTALGLNLHKLAVVLGDQDLGQYGDSITNWDDWKAPIPDPGIVRYSVADSVETFKKGMAQHETGYTRINVRYATAPDSIYDHIQMPAAAGTFRNSDAFALTWIHESTHLFAATSDSYYFVDPWEKDRFEFGDQNENDETDNGKPTTPRCLMNADSYAWFMWLLGDDRFQKNFA